MAINIDSVSSTLQEWTAFWRAVGGGEVLWAQHTENGATVAYRIQALGTTVIVDREGRVAYRDGYATPYQRLREEIEKLL